jgi:zinc/manganese transport system substrate-binding protein
MIRISTLLTALVATLAAALVAAPAVAALNIFACEPEWGALAKELAGPKASIYLATTAMQDPHRIEARPSLIARARSADLVVCTGAELEDGWMPLVQSQSGNAKIQKGQPGYFEAAAQVPLMDIPQRADRSQGDVHAAGNPHIHLDPANIAAVAARLAERMAQLDSSEAPQYRERAKTFLERWKTATARWDGLGAGLKGMPVVVYHRDLSYLVRWLGLREMGALESKPGLPPSASHLSGLLDSLGRNPASAIVRSAYNEPRAAQWLSERARIPVVVLPYTVGGTDKAGDLFGLFDDTLARLLEVRR